MKRGKKLEKHFQAKKYLPIGLIILIVVVSIVVSNVNKILPKEESNAKLGVTIISNYLMGGEWKEAEAKLELFSEEHLDRMQKLDRKGERRVFVEIRSPIISEYLPEYRVFTDQHFEFTLKKDGHVIGLGNTWPGKLPFQTAPDFELMNDSVFLEKQGFRVNSAEDAIEIVKLVQALHSNQDQDSELGSWKFEAFKKKNFWVVTMDYIGPPASIFSPPYWKIYVDEDNMLKTFSELPSGEPCDLNYDYECNEEDFQIFQQWLGTCADRGYNYAADADNDFCVTIYDQAELFPETFPIKLDVYWTSNLVNRTLGLGENECKKVCEGEMGKLCTNLIEICSQHQIKEDDMIEACNLYLQKNPQLLNEFACTFYVGRPFKDSAYRECNFACKVNS